MKTLADLKRDGDSGRMSMEFVYRYGEPIPERLQGNRRVLRSRSYGLDLLNLNGNESALRIENAKMIDYDGTRLHVYLPAITSHGIDKKIRGNLALVYDVHFD